MKDGIPYRNHSPYGWWVASYILRAAWDDEVQSTPESVYDVWENTIILQAPDRETAFDKAMRIASENQKKFEDASSPSRHGRWHLEGLTSLLPIYEELGDGAEILWKEREGVPLEKIRSLVKPKSDLEVFDDTPGVGDVV